MKSVTILWTHWSGYMDACVRALVEKFDCNVRIVYYQRDAEAPFDESAFFQYACSTHPWDGKSGDPLNDVFLPTDILLVCSWHIERYRELAKKWRGRSTRVLCMDNQWRFTAKQVLGCLTAPLYIQPIYDKAFVPGARQARFARRLGFKSSDIVEGHCSCDFDLFEAVHRARSKTLPAKTFLFVGRLVPEKGVDVLIEAWKEYIKGEQTPWRLDVVGTGPMTEALRDVPRCYRIGFVQPHELPDSFRTAGVFVLPSRFEPWGLVLHEAAAAGLPIICSSECGASDEFVKTSENGFLVKAGSVAELQAAFRKMAALTDLERQSMGERSFELAGGRTPLTWAKSVYAMREGQESRN